MTTTNKILDFLNNFGVPVKDNEDSSYVDLMMDNHKCIIFEDEKYYIPESSYLYDDKDVEIYNKLIENYLV